jgi:hypothetical protein
MKRKICRFDLKDLLPIGLVLIVAGIAIAYGLNVLGDVRDGFIEDDANYGAAGCESGEFDNCTTITAEMNASDNAITGVSNLPEKMPLIATVVVAAIIIGILVRYLMVRFA